MIKLKEYEKHVKDERTSNIEGRELTFCGQAIDDWFFTGPSHLVAARQCKDRLLPCPECKKKIIELLNNED